LYCKSAQHRRLRERHTRRERRRKRLRAGSADLVLAQAVKAGLARRAHVSWVVSIVGRTFYIAQYHRLLELCERHTRWERRRERLRAGSADLVHAQACQGRLTPRAHGS